MSSVPQSAPPTGAALVLTQTQGRVRVLQLHRPTQLNALNDALMDELGAALLHADADPAIGAIIVTGNEKAFAAGADIAAMTQWKYQDVVEQQFITRNWETIRQIRKPVLAAVAGFAMGGGCELALACDLIIAAHSARFALPEVKLAMLPGAGGTQRLPRAIGKAKAMDMCLSARSLSADEADRYGLVSRIVPDADLMSTTLALAQSIADFSMPAVAAIKASVNRAYESALSEGIGFERQMLYARFATADAHEGLAAFTEKRRPVFQHR